MDIANNYLESRKCVRHPGGHRSIQAGSLYTSNNTTIETEQHMGISDSWPNDNSVDWFLWPYICELANITIPILKSHMHLVLPQLDELMSISALQILHIFPITVPHYDASRINHMSR
ncbi:predicted protein [Lichtheimia corymbifera JMRC:FSU:9682]|uniref:Uncharacterized protein n=1 Tax=Lichtheimia corymbifera JMRC:FSU:9682 TaxID=1263082 RepID=A0A068RSH9_9FUNG|nr:predicted protein [Lichtheimia corymbifera JMRC:FSU:9682]